MNASIPNAIPNAIYFPCTLSASKNMESGVIKKEFHGIPNWQNLEESVVVSGRPHALQTGKRSGITAIDFDTLASYNRLVEEIPQLKDAYHVKTRKGYHLYFQYDARLKTGVDAFTLPAIDIRNDGGCVIAPPSSYSYKDEVFRYEAIGGEVIPIPEEMYAYMTQKAWIQEEPVVERAAPLPAVPMYRADMDLFTRCIALLKPSRADDYTHWRNVGFGIHNVMGNDGLNLFLEFSKQSNKYNERECIMFYRSIRDRGANNKITEATIQHWAKKDNLDEFLKLYNYTPRQLLFKGEAGMNNADTATCYYHMTEPTYVYSNQCWYRYKENNLIEKLTREYPSSLRKKVTDTLQHAVKQTLNAIPETDPRYTDYLKEAGKCHKLLGTSSFITGCLDYLKGMYEDAEFWKKLDMDLNILAFTNGVLDITTKTFRPLEREDYCSKSTGYAYSPIVNEQNRAMLKTELLNIFNTDEMVQWWLETIAMSLFGNKHEWFHIHTGSGGNGKGMLFNMLLLTLGEYYYQAPNEFLTTTYKADAPNSTLANAKGARMFVVSEPSIESTDGKKIKLSSDLIKALSGSDPINARDLYETSKLQWKATFVAWLQCNRIPELSQIDGGIRRRVKKTDYPNKFVAEPDQRRPNQKQANYDLKDLLQLPEYYKEFMRILWDVVCNFTKYHEPASVVESTKQHLDNADKVCGWLADYCEHWALDEQAGWAEAIPIVERIAKKDAHARFMEDTDTKITTQAFHAQMATNEVGMKKIGGKEYYFLKVKVREE